MLLIIWHLRWFEHVANVIGIFLKMIWMILSDVPSQLSTILIKTLRIGNDRLKVAHHTWIKFLESRRNSLIMKNEVTYDIYECTKRKWKIIFGKNMTFKNLFQLLSTKASGGFELGICGSKDQCPRPLSYMMIYTKVDRYTCISIFTEYLNRHIVT